MQLYEVDHEIIVPMAENAYSSRWLVKQQPNGPVIVDIYFNHTLAGIYPIDAVLLVMPSGDKTPLKEQLEYVRTNVRYKGGALAYFQKTLV